MGLDINYEVYEHFGFDLGNYSSYDRKNCEGNILICPNSALETGSPAMLNKLKLLIVVAGRVMKVGKLSY